MPKLLFLLLASLPAMADSSANIVQPLGFERPELWREHSFHGHTSYRFVVEHGQAIVRADSSAAASGLIRKISVDLDRTPYLTWSWKIEAPLQDNDERRKQGDDYPARIYIADHGGWNPWATKIVNYVWSSNQPVGSRWPSAYTDRSMMLAVRSGKPNGDGWYHEKRNVRTDFRELFGENVRHVDLIAIMTDTDDTGDRAVGWYGRIVFSSE